MPIEFEIRGHRAVITKVLPRLDRWGEWNELVAKVDFPDGGLPWLAMGVALPAREYTSEELIKYVTYDIERQLHEEAEERQKRKKADEAEAQLKDLANKVNKVIEGG